MVYNNFEDLAADHMGIVYVTILTLGIMLIIYGFVYTKQEVSIKSYKVHCLEGKEILQINNTFLYTGECR